MKRYAPVLFVIAAFCIGCTRSDSVLPPDDTRLSLGEWGGKDAGVIVGDTTVHVHIGCTLGDFPAPVALDQNRRFSVAGSYVLRAFPVQFGPPLPAQFAGVVEGDRLTFTVAVNDTVEKKVVALGPVTVRYKQAANMQQCPICSGDDDDRRMSRSIHLRIPLISRRAARASGSDRTSR
jgi:hypothetical protein